MTVLEFTAVFGEEHKEVCVSLPNGAPCGYEITINNFCQGTLFKRDGSWLVYLNRRSELSGDDISILQDMIDDV